jgi:hypothetical protein
MNQLAFLPTSEDGTSVLRGRLVDEASLYGVLMNIRDLALPLLSVARTENEELSEASKALHRHANARRPTGPQTVAEHAPLLT